MIVRCDACAKRYHLDDEVIGSSGRNVRCTACGYVWHQPPMPPSLNPLLTLPVPLPQSPNKKKQRYKRLLFWILFAALCLSALWYVRSKIPHVPFMQPSQKTI